MTDEKQKQIRVTGLKVSNYAGLQEFELEPAQVTILAGPNGAGKTSVLNSLIDAMSKGGIDEDSIHMDAERAEIRVKLSDGMDIQKVRIRGGSQRTKIERDDAVLKSPQRVLNTLLDPVQLDPVAWLSGDRTAALLDSMPLRITAEDLHALYQEAGVKASARTIPKDLDRHAVQVIAGLESLLTKDRKADNLEVKQLKGWLEKERAALGGIEDPTPKIDAAQAEQAKVAGELAEARATALRISEAVDRRDESVGSLSRQRGAVKGLRERLAEIQEQIEAAEKEEQERATVADAAEISLSKLEKEAPDIDTTVEKLETWATETATAVADLKEQRGAWEEAVKQKGRVEDEAKRLEGIQDRVKILNAAVRVFRAAPGDLLAKADLPVDGLSFDDGRLTLDGVPVGQLSGAETMRLAVRIAEHRAQAQRGQFVLLDGLEQLDDEQRAAMLEEVAESSVQWLMTEVGVRGDAGDALVVVMGAGDEVPAEEENASEDASQGASGENAELWEKQHSEMARKHPDKARTLLNASDEEIEAAAQRNCDNDSEGTDDDANTST